MERRDFFKNASLGFAVAGLPLGNQTAAGSGGDAKTDGNSNPCCRDPHDRPKDYKKEPFKRLVILGESHVAGRTLAPPAGGPLRGRSRAADQYLPEGTD